jgi:phytoene dehydrogenase-like protein
MSAGATDAIVVGAGPNGRQLVFRPTPALDPYRAAAGIYLSSSSTPPGGGVHGMARHLAARSALRHELR